MSKPLTPDELAAIRKRWAKSTKGDWRLGTYNVWCDTRFIACTDTLPKGYRRNYVVDDEDERNADFIANAHQDVPRLLDEVDRLRAALISAGAEITVARNGFQTPQDLDWVDRHIKAAQEIINQALAALEGGDEDA